MVRTRNVALVLSLLLVAATSTRAQGTVNAAATAGGTACPQTLYPGPLAVSACLSGDPFAEAYSFAEFGSVANVVAGTRAGTFSSLASTAAASGAWNDILTWSDPAVSRVVFTFLWGNELYVRSHGLPLLGVNGAWASSVLNASIPLSGGPSAHDSSYLAAGGFPGADPSLTFTQFVARPVLSVPVAGLTSIPLSFSWNSNGFAIGDAEASSSTWAELLTVQLYDASGQRLLPRYQFANGAYVAEVTPEPAPFLLFATGIGGLLGLVARRRRREA